MNTMSSGSLVFFIQNATRCGCAKSNSMPWSAAIASRNIRPRSCSSGVRATSTSKRWRAPLPVWITRVSVSMAAAGGASRPNAAAARSANAWRRLPRVRSVGASRQGEGRGSRMDIEAHIRRIPDFPKPGILFYDISTLLNHAEAWRVTIDRMADAVAAYRPQLLAGIESRGFIFAAPIAYRLGLGFVMVRKLGKLPGAVISHSYDLEYGSDTLQVADGLVERGTRVVLVDDLIATGGTARASVQLLGKIGAEVVGAVFLIELLGLKGRDGLGAPSTSLLAYEGG